MAVEWTITIEGRNEFGDVCRRAIRIDTSRERLFDGDLGLSIEDGKTIVTLRSSDRIRWVQPHSKISIAHLGARACGRGGVLTHYRRISLRHIEPRPYARSRREQQHADPSQHPILRKLRYILPWFVLLA